MEINDRLRTRKLLEKIYEKGDIRYCSLENFKEEKIKDRKQFYDDLKYLTEVGHIKWADTGGVKLTVSGINSVEGRNVRRFERVMKSLFYIGTFVIAVISLIVLLS